MSTTQTAAATFTRLKDGSWGVRAPAGTTIGQRLTVTKRDGSTSTVTVSAILWTGTAKDGRQASLVSIAPTAGRVYRQTTDSRDLRRARAAYARTGDYYGSGLYDEES